VYSKLGWAHALDGNVRQELSFYHQALALDAYDLFGLIELGKYYFMMGDRRRCWGVPPAGPCWCQAGQLR